MEADASIVYTHIDPQYVDMSKGKDGGRQKGRKQRRGGGRGAKIEMIQPNKAMYGGGEKMERKQEGNSIC